jgi:uncharacterized protein
MRPRGKPRAEASGYSTRLSIRAQPKSSRSQILGWQADGTLKIAITAPPVDGAANEAIVELLASVLGVPKRAVAIARGQTGRNKLVDIEGMSEAEVRALIDSRR